MTDKPCQKAIDEFKQATIEWTQAAEESKTFLSLEPISLYEDIEARPPEYFDSMNHAFKKEEETKKKYLAKYQALDECWKKLKEQIK